MPAVTLLTGSTNDQEGNVQIVKKRTKKLKQKYCGKEGNFLLLPRSKHLQCNVHCLVVWMTTQGCLFVCLFV